MKKNIIIYIVSIIALALSRFLIYSMVENISLIAFVVLNLVPPSLIIIVANAIINYDNEGTLKSCLTHAVILATLSLVINLSATGIFGDQSINNLIENQVVNEDDDISQELWDELDRQARQKMLEEGLISEDEIIYSEPYISNQNDNKIEDNNIYNEQLTATWDVQIEKENPLSTITGAILDILLAFIGGIIGLKLSSSKDNYKYIKECNNC